jgi:hypothetical protein
MLNNGFHGKTSQPVRDAKNPKHTAPSQVTRKSPHGTADDCHKASCQHYERTHRSGVRIVQPEPRQPNDVAAGGNSAGPPSSSLRGDIIYGAAAVAAFIFGESHKKARRRVYNLWTFYRDRHERAGFLKLKGSLCLSITRWRAFHGLD